jgi:hypothetical protein
MRHNRSGPKAPAAKNFQNPTGDASPVPDVAGPGEVGSAPESGEPTEIAPNPGSAAEPGKFKKGAEKSASRPFRENDRHRDE